MQSAKQVQYLMLYVVLYVVCCTMERRHDDIQTKAARAVGIFVVDTYRRSQVCLISWFV